MASVPAKMKANADTPALAMHPARADGPPMGSVHWVILTSNSSKSMYF